MKSAGPGHGRARPGATREISGWEPSHLLWLAVLGALLCFVACSIYVDRWANELDAAALSIADDGAPSVLYLSTAREDIRLIERRTTLAQPSSRAADRAAIDALTRDFNEAVRAYRTTEDYPGEREAYEVMSRERTMFFAAVADVLARVSDEAASREASSAHLTSATDGLIAATRTLVTLNAAAVAAASTEIARLRHRIGVLAYTRDALAFFLAIFGTVMGLRGARQRFAVIQERSRLNELRAGELDIFAGRVAHDLRSPLSAILMRCEAAARSQKPEAAREALDRVTHQGRRMSEIIDALLAFARAGAQPDPGKSCEVATVVLSNLVSNAIKYMGEVGDGVRRITIRGHPRGSSMRIDVEDTGPGIPPGAEATVFEPFVRLPSRAAGASGVGLGLATVKRLVEAHRGRVGVEARSGGGCRFWFTLPTCL